MQPEDTVIPEGSSPDDFIRVDVETDGGVFTARNVISAGSPKKPLSKQQILDKFRDCMSFGVKKCDAEAVIRAIDSLDRGGSVKDLFSAAFM